MLCIGAGRGVFDLSLLQNFAAQSLNSIIEYTAIEPNAQLREQLIRNIHKAQEKGLLKQKVQVRDENLHSRLLGKNTYNLILLSHSIYHFKFPGLLIKELLKHLGSGGVIFVIQQGEGGISDIQNRYGLLLDDNLKVENSFSAANSSTDENSAFEAVSQFSGPPSTVLNTIEALDALGITHQCHTIVSQLRLGDFLDSHCHKISVVPLLIKILQY